LEDLGVDGRIKSKRNLDKYGMKMRIQCKCALDRILWIRWWNLGFYRDREFLDQL